MNIRRTLFVFVTTLVLSGTLSTATLAIDAVEETTGPDARNPIELDPGGNFANNSKIGSYTVEEYDGAWGGPTGGPVLIAAQMINVLLQLLGLVSLLLIFYAGFVWMMARGNEDDIKKAKDIIIGTTIGMLVILASYSFMRFIFEAVACSTDTYTGIMGC